MLHSYSSCSREFTLFGLLSDSDCSGAHTGTHTTTCALVALGLVPTLAPARRLSHSHSLDWSGTCMATVLMLSLYPYWQPHLSSSRTCTLLPVLASYTTALLVLSCTRTGNHTRPPLALDSYQYLHVTLLTLNPVPILASALGLSCPGTHVMTHTILVERRARSTLYKLRLLPFLPLVAASRCRQQDLTDTAVVRVGLDQHRQPIDFSTPSELEAAARFPASLAPSTLARIVALTTSDPARPADDWRRTRSCGYPRTCTSTTASDLRSPALDL